VKNKITMADYATLNIQPTEITVEPGETGSSVIKLQNISTLVDVFQISVSSLGSDFYLLSQTEFRLFPGDDAELEINFSPPASSSSLAGLYEFTVNLTSRNHPGETLSIPATVEVSPYYAFETSIRPERVTGSSGEFSLSITNQSNTALSFQGRGEDPEDFCRFQFPSDSVEISPGQQLEVPVRVTTRKRPFRGSPKSYSLSIAVTPDQVSDLRTMRAQFDATARLKGWAIPAALVLFSIALIAVYSAFWGVALQNDWTFFGSENWDQTVTVDYSLSHGTIYSFTFCLDTNDKSESYIEGMCAPDTDVVPEDLAVDNSNGSDQKTTGNGSVDGRGLTSSARQVGVTNTSKVDQAQNEIDSITSRADRIGRLTQTSSGNTRDLHPSLKFKLDWDDSPDVVSSLTIILRTPEGNCSTPKRISRETDFHEYTAIQLAGMKDCNELELATVLMDESSHTVSEYQYLPIVKYCAAPDSEKIIYESEGVPLVDKTYTFDTHFKPYMEHYVLYVINEASGSNPEIDGPPSNATIQLKASQNGSKPLKPLFFYRGNKKHLLWDIKLRDDVMLEEETRRFQKVQSVQYEKTKKGFTSSADYNSTGCSRLWDNESLIKEEHVKHGLITGFQLLGCARVYWHDPGCSEEHYSPYLEGLESLVVGPTWSKEKSNVSNEFIFVVRDPYGNCWFKTFSQTDEEPDPESPLFQFSLKIPQTCEDVLDEEPNGIKSLMNWKSLKSSDYFNSDPLVKICIDEDSGLSMFNKLNGDPLVDPETWINNPNVSRTQPGWYVYVINFEEATAPSDLNLRIKGDETRYRLKLKEIEISAPTPQFSSSSTNSRCSGLPRALQPSNGGLKDQIRIYEFTDDFVLNQIVDGKQLKKFDIGIQIGTGIPSSFAWSQVGDRLAWSSKREGNGQIYIADYCSLYFSNCDCDRFSGVEPKLITVTSVKPKPEKLDSDLETYVETQDIYAEAQKITFNSANDTEPTWSPDGNFLAFTSDRDGDKEIYIVEVGTKSACQDEQTRKASESTESQKYQPARKLTNSPASQEYQPNWSSSNGINKILYTSTRSHLTKGAADTAGNQNDEDIYVTSWSDETWEENDAVNLTAGLKTTLGKYSNESNGRWSENGTDVVFVSNQGGSNDIWLMTSSLSDEQEFHQLTKTPEYKESSPVWAEIKEDETNIIYKSEYDFISDGNHDKTNEVTLKRMELSLKNDGKFESIDSNKVTQLMDEQVIGFAWVTSE
jgi:hypothetical protein